MQRPEMLFHGSVCQDIDYLEPRGLTVRQADEGSVVFATPSRALASCFMIPWDDSFATLNVLPDGSLHFTTSDMQRLEESDQGGSIYSLLPHDFSCDENTGLQEYEWTSTVTQQPLHEEKHVSALQAMQKNGIQFIQMSQDEFDDFMQLDYAERSEVLLMKNGKPAKNKETVLTLC